MYDWLLYHSCYIDVFNSEVCWKTKSAGLTYTFDSKTQAQSVAGYLAEAHRSAEKARQLRVIQTLVAKMESEDDQPMQPTTQIITLDEDDQEFNEQNEPDSETEKESDSEW